MDSLIYINHSSIACLVVIGTQLYYDSFKAYAVPFDVHASLFR